MEWYRDWQATRAKERAHEQITTALQRVEEQKREIRQARFRDTYMQRLSGKPVQALASRVSDRELHHQRVERRLNAKERVLTNMRYQLDTVDDLKDMASVTETLADLAQPYAAASELGKSLLDDATRMKTSVVGMQNVHAQIQTTHDQAFTDSLTPEEKEMENEHTQEFVLQMKEELQRAFLAPAKTGIAAASSTLRPSTTSAEVRT